jgi:hypothetical protein
MEQALRPAPVSSTQGCAIILGPDLDGTWGRFGKTRATVLSEENSLNIRSFSGWGQDKVS